MDIRHGALFLGGLRASDLVARYGSPLYVIEQDRVLAQVEGLRQAFPDVRFLFAGKANPNPAIWKLVHEQGCGLDCCSPGEVEQALQAGFAPREVSFTGTALTDDDMRYLVGTGVSVHVDALSQVARYGRIAGPGRGLGIRVNPGAGTGSHEHCTTAGDRSKLGIPYDQASEALGVAQEAGLRIESLHCHTGSGGLDAGHFVDTAERMFALARLFVGSLTTIDLGGGIGVPHSPADEPFDLPHYAGAVQRLRASFEKETGVRLQVVLEPGQFLVAEAGWLLMTAVIVKTGQEGTSFVLTDSSYNHYLGTALYMSYHDIFLADRMEESPSKPSNICGHLCNTGDTFAAERSMPEIEEGSLLAMAQTGAYGISRSSNYNSRPIPAEVLVSGGRARLIRRRQTVADLSQWYMDGQWEPGDAQDVSMRGDEGATR